MEKRLEINVKLPHKKAAYYVRHYLNEQERRNLIQEVNDSGVLLYDYYLRLAAVGDVEITDERAAEYFGWPQSKAKRTRLQLVKKGWFKESRYTIEKVRKGVTYYLGKDSVASTQPSGK